MKSVKNVVSVCLLSIITFMNCSEKNEDLDLTETVAFNSMEGFFEANGVQYQDFTLDASAGGTITGEEGTIITIPPNIFLKPDGNLATGAVKVSIKEVFKASDMIMSNKPTNAISPTGEQTFLISEGETEVKATQAGVDLQIAADKNITISVPAAGGPDDSMRAFTGNPNQQGTNTMLWTVARPQVQIVPPSSASAVSKYVYDAFSTGWRNCDKFYSYPGLKTTSEVNLTTSPERNETMVFIVFKDDNRPAVVRYTTNYTNGIKSYTNMVPVGLEVTFVAISIKDNVQYIATKTHTIAEDEEIDLTFTEVTTQEIKDALAALN